MESPELSTSISGSFKFKPEIDAAHEIFRDHNVIVLAPGTGWLYMTPAKLSLITAQNMLRPLPIERGMSPKQIENSFLESIRESDFLYVMNKESYMGNSTAFELGFALGIGKPVYAAEPILFEEVDLQIRDLVNDYVKVMPIEQVANHFRENYLR
jgi:nucleoside 2-deoxyribosyltransferase